MSFVSKPNCCFHSSFILFFWYSNNLSGLAERVTKNICGLLSGVDVPVMLFSRLTKTANRPEECFGLIVLHVIFPSQGCLAQVQGLGFYEKCCTNGLSPARWKRESEWQEFQRLSMESFKGYLWSRLCFYTLYFGMSSDGDVLKKKGKRVLKFVGDHLKHFLSLLCLLSRYWTSMTFRHFHAKCGLTLVLKGSTIPLTIP